MVASVSNSTSGVANWTDSVFSKLDTKNQGYIDKSDMAGALSATGKSDGSGDSSALDDMFNAIDGDSDGKVTKSELSEAASKLSDQLNAQFDASRVQGGMPPGPPPGGAPSDGASSSSADGSVGAAGAAGSTPPAGGMHGAGGPRGAGGAGGAGAADSTDGTDSATTSTDYVAAADTDGDGTASDAEQAAYDKKVASGEIDKNGNGTGSTAASGDTERTRQQDPTRELAQALHMLKAYAENGGNSDASTASTGKVSVDA
jgi:hypothetical protein